MHYFAVYDGMPTMTSREITDALIQAKVPRAKKMNVSAVLSALVPSVDRLDDTRDGVHLWTLTDTGRGYLRDTLGLTRPSPGKASGTTAPAATATRPC